MVHGDEVDQALARLRAEGERVTTARRVVLEQVAAAHGEHLSADDLAHRIQTEHPEIHLSTIYRTLDFLTGAGILIDVRLGSGPATYHFVGEAHHHHAVCSTCGAMIESGPESLDPMIRRLDEEHGFLADPSHLVVRGLCRSCRSD